MIIGTLEKNSEWGAKIILDDLSKMMPKDAQKDSSLFLKSCDLIIKKAEILLKKIETYELNLKKTKQYQNKSSVQLFIYYSQAKHAQSLKRIMIEAYAFISYLREWLTGIAIEYLIEVDNKKSVQVLHLTLEKLINLISVGTSKDKGFRLSISLSKKTEKMIEDVEHFSNFEKDLKDIENNLVQILQQVTTRANAKNGVKRERMMNKLGIAGDKLNKGFVTETAVQMYAALGNAAKNIKDPVQLAAFYQSTVGNLPGFRGGDIDEETTQKFLQQEKREFNRKVEFQVKRVQGLFGATVIEINTLKYELFNIAVKIKMVKNKGAKVLKEELTNYFISKDRASKVAKELAQSLGVELENSLSNVLKDIPNITIT